MDDIGHVISIVLDLARKIKSDPAFAEAAGPEIAGRAFDLLDRFEKLSAEPAEIAATIYRTDNPDYDVLAYSDGGPYVRKVKIAKVKAAREAWGKPRG